MSTEGETEDIVEDWEVDDVSEIDAFEVAGTDDGGAASDADTARENCGLVQEQDARPNSRSTVPVTIGEHDEHQAAFLETMARRRFQQIRGALTLHLPEHPSFDKERDLWRWSGVMEHFQQPFAHFAVPIGVSSIDEMTVRKKARTRAKTLTPSKPDKYGVRFYADTDVSIEADSATAMWMAMAGHQSQALRSPTGHRLAVSDNFYTRHTFAQALLKFTDGEMHLLGAVRFTLVDKRNKAAVKDAIERVDAGDRGSWERSRSGVGLAGKAKRTPKSSASSC
ncbi:Transposase IS4 [Phytophthora infestans]|uniref:Transposase IS4 n=1 Tax=Phytophthora infestans TaxID=4787 RepID=A0A8S9TUL4_PHYIN|nr:Transposase IS4 [Phytophthora infestans]